MDTLGFNDFGIVVGKLLQFNLLPGDFSFSFLNLFQQFHSLFLIRILNNRNKLYARMKPMILSI